MLVWPRCMHRVFPLYFDSRETGSVTRSANRTDKYRNWNPCSLRTGFCLFLFETARLHTVVRVCKHRYISIAEGQIMLLTLVIATAINKYNVYPPDVCPIQRHHKTYCPNHSMFLHGPLIYFSLMFTHLKYIFMPMFTLSSRFDGPKHIFGRKSDLRMRRQITNESLIQALWWKCLWTYL